jgi:hypothetical protein
MIASSAVVRSAIDRGIPVTSFVHGKNPAGNPGLTSNAQ